MDRQFEFLCFSSHLYLSRLLKGFTHSCPCFPGGSVSKEFACNAGETGSIPGSGRSPGKGNGIPFQYSCLENPMNCASQLSEEAGR